MPYYNYTCYACGTAFLRRSTIQEYAALKEKGVECPTCGENDKKFVRQNINTPLTIIYRGGGWGGE